MIRGWGTPDIGMGKIPSLPIAIYFCLNSTQPRVLP